MNEISHSAMDWRKRKLEEDSLNLEGAKRPRYKWYFKLESESSVASEEDTESVYSLQDKETDVVQDSSDTDTKSESGSSVGSGYEVELEYEVASASENEGLHENASSSDADDLYTEDILAAVIVDTSLEAWASDSEDSDTTDVDEISRTFGTCAQCKSRNNNPSFRLCEKCFKERKHFYPPRPRRLKKKGGAASTSSKEVVNVDRLRSCLNELSQDTDIGSSEDVASLDFKGIEVPDVRKKVQEADTVSESEDCEAPANQVHPCLSGLSQDSGIGSSQEFCSFNFKEIDVPTASDEMPKKQDGKGGVGEVEDEKQEERDVEEVSVRSGSQDSGIGSVHELLSPKDVDVAGIASGEVPYSKRTEEKGSVGGIGKAEESDQDDKCLKTVARELCIICNSRSKNSAFLHGNSGHISCCYKCAIRTWRVNRKCPICNRQAKQVVKLYTA